MKKLLAVGSLAVLLGGCATSYLDGTGHNKISDNTYIINAGANPHSYLGQQEDMALLRAAEIACQKQYPYFRVLDRDISQSGGYDYIKMTVQLSWEKTPYETNTILKSMKGRLESDHPCSLNVNP